MPDESWQLLMAVGDVLSAQALAERLKIEGVPALVQADSSPLGVLSGVARRCEIYVPKEMLRRAEALLTPDRFSDEELAKLATDSSAATDDKLWRSAGNVSGRSSNNRLQRPVRDKVLSIFKGGRPAAEPGR